MSTLFIDRRDVQLEHDAGALIIRSDGQRLATVPLAPITRVFLRGSVQLSASVLGHLGDRGIGVIILSGRKGVPTLFFGRPRSDATLRVKQTRKSFDSTFCLDYARHLVRTKVQNQHDWLEALRGQRPQHRYPLTHAMGILSRQLGKINEIADLDSLRGLEGAAASAYFSGLRAVVPPSLGFNERNRRPPRDPFNVLLSLSYTMVHAETALNLHAAGLDPFIGFYHQISHSRESLACDLVETVRTLVDQLCLELVSQQILTLEHFSSGSSGCILGKAGRTRYYGVYEDHAADLRKKIRSEIRALIQRIDPQEREPEFITPSWDDGPHSKIRDSLP